MIPKFGTSGLRGLAVSLNDDLIADYIHAFLLACSPGVGLWVGRDLRASSPRIAEAVMSAARAAGVTVTDCGPVPTPALALRAGEVGAAAVMVTGSHIPADRNGLKFFTPSGEITKADEARIIDQLGSRQAAQARAPLTHCYDVGADWVARYLSAFGPHALSGMRIGVWSHSAVSRDFLHIALLALGAYSVDCGRSQRFVPVDTEALSQKTRAQIEFWVKTHRLDALISTDGDGDRPLVADQFGQVVPGDLLGQITAAALKAETVVTPVSSSTAVEQSCCFACVIRTRIGSPYVIAEMAQRPGRTVGYEANGGFLLGFDAQGTNGPLPPLMTRDSLLPILVTLMEARRFGGLARRVDAEPHRFTAADRLTNIPQSLSARLVEMLKNMPDRMATFWGQHWEIPREIGDTDGLRVVLTSGRVLHIRPSGNAPELRLYVEAESATAAQELLSYGLSRLVEELTALGA